MPRSPTDDYVTTVSQPSSARCDGLRQWLAVVARMMPSSGRLAPILGRASRPPPTHGMLLLLLLLLPLRYCPTCHYGAITVLPHLPLQCHYGTAPLATTVPLRYSPTCHYGPTYNHCMPNRLCHSYCHHNCYYCFYCYCHCYCRQTTPLREACRRYLHAAAADAAHAAIATAAHAAVATAVAVPS